MIGQLSSLVGDEVGTRVYDLLNRVQLWRVCAVFFSGLLPPVYVLLDRMQMWRICSLFFYFSLAAPWSGKAPQAGAKEIWCNCGAFAPYFFQVRFLLLDAHWGGSCTFLILIIPAQALGRYMSFNLLIGIAEHPARADNGF